MAKTWSRFLDESGLCKENPVTGKRPCDDGRLCDSCQTEEVQRNFKAWKAAPEGDGMLRTTAHFHRKAVNVEELKRLPGNKQNQVPCIVEQLIELEPEEYDKFSQHLLDDYNFIEEMVNYQCVDSDGHWHCILVKGKGQQDGILVQGEGYYYARYSAYLPDTSKLLTE